MKREPFHPGLDHPRDTLADGSELQEDDFATEGTEWDTGPRIGPVVALMAFALVVVIGLALQG